MWFNLDHNKEGDKFFLSDKANTEGFLPVELKCIPVKMYESQKYLGIILDKRLNFHEHIKRRFKICNKLICINKHLSVSRSFVRPHIIHK